MTIKELFMFGILKAYQVEIAQGDIPDNEKYTVESNTLFLEYIGEETDLRNVQNDKPIKTAEDIRKEQLEKGYVVRKD